MTNHWNDIDNASLVFVMGANPSENHPACMAHINAARARGAKLVVVDPRKTRTALQADDYIRIRPGTDIAFINAMLNYIFTSGSDHNATAIANMLASHNSTATNSTAARVFMDDDGAAATVTMPKYTDSRVLVNNATNDYQRAEQIGSWVNGSSATAMAVGTRPTIVRESSTLWHMYYLDGGTLKYASATDGKAWTVGTAPTLDGGSFAAASDSPFVWLDVSTLYMVVNTPTDTIALYSAPLATPTVFTTVVASVLTPAMFSGATDVPTALDAPMVLKNATADYYLYVQGKNAGNIRRFYMTKITAVPTAWTTDGGSVASVGVGGQIFGPSLSGGWDDLEVMHPSVCVQTLGKYKNTFELWYTGKGVANTTMRIGLATSPDGIVWTRRPLSGTQGWIFGNMANNVATPGASASKPRMVKSGVLNFLYYEEQTQRINYLQPAYDGAISNFPVRAATVTTGNTVWNKLKAHAAEYDLATAASICGCQQGDIVKCAQYFIDHSRFNSVDWNAALATPEKWPTAVAGDLVHTGGYRAATWLYAMGGTQHTYGSQNIRQYAVIQSLMGNMGRAGGGINALRGIHNVQGSTDMGLLYDTYPAYGTIGKSTQTWASYLNLQFGYRTVGTGAKDPTSYAALSWQQRGFYNMTRQFFAGAQVASSTVVPDESKVLSGTAPATLAKGGIVPGTLVVRSAAGGGGTLYVEGTDYYAALATDTYGTGSAKIQRTAGSTIPDSGTVYVSYTWAAPMTGASVAALWDYWPKNNGYDHITAFRKMRSSVEDADRVKACFILGQNPAVTEPNQSAVRNGLYDLDLLVVQELFATETVQCSRKGSGVTYLLPSCAYPEEAGSVTNSGRWLQWRQQAAQPKGNSKTDLELVLRLGKAIDDAAGFSHLPAIAPGFASRFEQLFGYYTPGWTPAAGTFNCEAFAENVFKEIAAPYTEYYTGTDLRRYTINAGDPLLRGTTMWIYYNAYANWLEDNTFNAAFTTAYSSPNRAKSRDKTAGTANIYAKWGWAWLKNRRVFYNNGEVPQDVADNFVAPDYLARLFTNRNTAAVDYAAGAGLAYRNYKVMKDVSSVDATHANGKNGTNTYGIFPAHSEMIESNRPDLTTTWGTNEYIDTASYDAGIWDESASPTPAVFHECYPTDGATKIGASNTTANGGPFPLLLMTIRCVEHFQGGPITRNNSWNVEAEPVPWIEINSLDAHTYRIRDGDMVDVTTARSNSTNDQMLLRPNPSAGDAWAKGFVARVGSGLQSNQRVAKGVVAIPWHWGERGLATGSRANDLCIDASDANTKIPEYKACLCKIEKIV